MSLPDREVSEELTRFVTELAAATNTHNFDNVEPFIHPDATYWFTGGREFRGIDAIRESFISTWARIQDERYFVNNVEWPLVTPNAALYTYDFHWHGVVDGIFSRGNGRGSNALEKIGDKWKVRFEHLSRND